MDPFWRLLRAPGSLETAEAAAAGPPANSQDHLLSRLLEGQLALHDPEPLHSPPPSMLGTPSLGAGQQRDSGGDALPRPVGAAKVLRRFRSPFTTPSRLQDLLFEPEAGSPVLEVTTKEQALPPSTGLGGGLEHHAGAGTVDPAASREWLLHACRDHVRRFAPDTGISPAKLAMDVFLLLHHLQGQGQRGDSSGEAVQTALVDLLGFDNIEWVEQLFSRRHELVEAILAQGQQQQEGAGWSALPPTKRSGKEGHAPAPAGPKYGAQVSIQTVEERERERAMRKEQRKQRSSAKGGATAPLDAAAVARLLGVEGEYLREARISQLEGAASAPLIGEHQRPIHGGPEQHANYPYVFNHAAASQIRHGLLSHGNVLPVGSTREDWADYEEITMPASAPASQVAVEAGGPVLISSLDPFAQRAFKGYKSLNRIQSIIFPTAYKTNENMLVCAPTGAGKTDCAMLTILRTLSQHRVPPPPPGELMPGLADQQQHRLALDNFKIVYVAPMKALAAEMVRKFSARLASLGVTVRELTGDMQLTKAELRATQMIVTTPEKYDVVTRKGVGDTEFVQKVRLLIIDEVHLLHDDRGAVIESLVARTLRLVESNQSLIRIIGLSATLPNYVDVASFLGVNPYKGLFFFDSRFRPIPLEQHLIGIKAKGGQLTVQRNFDTVCYEKALAMVRQGHQVMVFVHARKATVKTAMTLREEATQSGELGLFDPSTHTHYGAAVKSMSHSRNHELKLLFASGFGIHHAGMLRSDRAMVEELFERGVIKVLCCTATLAWGVNLPAHCVIIKGTQVYDAAKGAFQDLSILDVLQIFGRAGRPQYETEGVAYILTEHASLARYVSAISQQHPIESRFNEHLTDNLNAEITLGTVTNLEEAVKWLSYSYLYVRMRQNPLHYGVDWREVQEDPTLLKRRRQLLVTAARTLHRAQMITFHEESGLLSPKNYGRIAASYYISTETMQVVNGVMTPHMNEADVLSLLAMSTEFANIKVRREEGVELKALRKGCVCDVKGDVDTSAGKTNILLQGYINRACVEDFALISDTAYVAQNSARIIRALFEVAMSRNWGPTAYTLLSICKTIDRRLWSFEHPLRQFDLPPDILDKAERAPHASVEELRDLEPAELGQLVRNTKYGMRISTFLHAFPLVRMSCTIAPITNAVLRIRLEVVANFVWSDRIHGGAAPFWIWVEDSESTHILHSEYLLLQRKGHGAPKVLEIVVPIPRTADGQVGHMYVRAISDRWLGSETTIPVPLETLVLPDEANTHFTDLLDLQPLPITALKDPVLEGICGARFAFFNPVQTQIFHTLYHTDHNVLVGAPTGSGKTIAAELAMWAAFRNFPKGKVIYVAPLKALVRERMRDWKTRLMPPMGRSIVELTGDVSPDAQSLLRADVIVTTPEKWDGITRFWRVRNYVQQVSLVLFDEIHLLGGDRGPILEVIVSRMNYISAVTGRAIRLVGLSTALANASDLGDWLGTTSVGLFNFRHSVRPVPLEIHISGHAGKHYCPRMISMNKPTYNAILTHSPESPVIVFVSSRRQTRLTAKDLISFCANDERPKRFLNLSEEDLELICTRIKDPALKLALGFGIGIHHAGLVESDRATVEELYLHCKIQVLIATSTLAWGVNFPAHLVVVKGTEYYDARVKQYVDLPITDILQMVGRAGRPQFDTTGVACVMVQDVKKQFFKKFLHEPFPVESQLQSCLHEHVLAELVAGTIQNKQDAVDYITWTYLYRRIRKNPTYYGLENGSEACVARHLSGLVEGVVADLARARCLECVDGYHLSATSRGQIAAQYYLQYKTIRIFGDALPLPTPYRGNEERADFAHLLRIVCQAAEYDELPVRHNEDLANQALERVLPLPMNEACEQAEQSVSVGPTTTPAPSMTPRWEYEDPHAKAFLLLQAHLERVDSFPVQDYKTDTISVLDQTIRILQALIDLAAPLQASTTLGLISMMQCIKQALWPTASPLLMLPHLDVGMLEHLEQQQQRPGMALPSLRDLVTWARGADGGGPGGQRQRVTALFAPLLPAPKVQRLLEVLDTLPSVEVTLGLDSLNGGQLHALKPAHEYALEVCVTRARRGPPGGRVGDGIYSPRFPKPQTEGWFLLLQASAVASVGAEGPSGDGPVLAMHRLGPLPGGRVSKSLPFLTPEAAGTYVLTIHLCHDGLLGLDQVHSCRVSVQ